MQADQTAAERFRQNFADFGFTDTGLAFEEQRAAELQCQIERGRERTVGDIVSVTQHIDNGINGGGKIISHV